MIVDDDLCIVVDDVVNSLDLSCIYKKVSSEGNLPYHPSIVVDDVVNSLDLSCIYKKVSSEGNLPYHPKMMLKVLFYEKSLKRFGKTLLLFILLRGNSPTFAR
jgi:hypothetical protein